MYCTSLSGITHSGVLRGSTAYLPPLVPRLASSSNGSVMISACWFCDRQRERRSQCFRNNPIAVQEQGIRFVFVSFRRCVLRAHMYSSAKTIPIQKHTLVSFRPCVTYNKNTHSAIVKTIANNGSCLRSIQKQTVSDMVRGHLVCKSFAFWDIFPKVEGSAPSQACWTRENWRIGPALLEF